MAELGACFVLHVYCDMPGCDANGEFTGQTLADARREAKVHRWAYHRRGADRRGAWMTFCRRHDWYEAHAAAKHATESEDGDER